MVRRDAAAFLKSLPIFAALPDKEVQTLAAVAREKRYRTREYVFREGDPALWFCIVKSGRVKIFKQAKTGKDVVLDLFGPNELFGGVAVIERRPYPASAQATEPTVAVKLPQESVVALAEGYPLMIKELALMMGRRLRTAYDSMKSLATDPVEARVAGMLLRLAEREASQDSRGLTLPFHLTRQSLADMAGTTVETTIRIVSAWLKDGVVLTEGGRLVLADIAALRKLAGGERD